MLMRFPSCDFGELAAGRGEERRAEREAAAGALEAHGVGLVLAVVCSRRMSPDVLAVAVARPGAADVAAQQVKLAVLIGGRQ